MVREGCETVSGDGGTTRAVRGVRRRLLLGAAVLTASSALALAIPATASAAASSSCAGQQVRSFPFATGTVRVYRKSGYVCALTVARYPARKRPMQVSIQARGNRPVVDTGHYTHQAGPITVHAGQRCVWVRGAVDGVGVSSGWFLC